MNKRYVISVEEDDHGNLVLPFTDEILKEVGWKINDKLNWKDNGDGSFTLTKKETEIKETELVLVECVSQFRQRYVCEVPKGQEDWALDTVASEKAVEFSQKHLGETIISHRVVSKEEALRLCDEDNEYCSNMDEEKKMNLFITCPPSME